VFKAHRLVYPSTLGLRVIKKKKKNLAVLVVVDRAQSRGRVGRQRLGELAVGVVGHGSQPRGRVHLLEGSRVDVACRVWGAGCRVQGVGCRVQGVGCRVCGSEAGSYLRLIDSCITQLKAQGPSRTCNESKEEEKVWG